MLEWGWGMVEGQWRGIYTSKQTQTHYIYTAHKQHLITKFSVELQTRRCSIVRGYTSWHIEIYRYTDSDKGIHNTRLDKDLL